MEFEENKIDNIDEIDVRGKDLNKILRLMVSSRKRFKFSCTGKSMSPFFHNCNLIEIDPVDFNDVRIGDVVFYYNKGSNLIAHRVVKKSIENKKLRLITKGDFASRTDAPIEKSDLIGKSIAVYNKNGFISSRFGISRYPGFIIAKISLLSCYIWPFLKVVSRYCKIKKANTP